MSESPERSLLESKSRDELVQIAEAAGVQLAARARKAAIVDAILGDSPQPEPADDNKRASNGGKASARAGKDTGGGDDAADAANAAKTDSAAETDNAAKTDNAADGDSDEAETGDGPKIRRVRRTTGETKESGEAKESGEESESEATQTEGDAGAGADRGSQRSKSGDGASGGKSGGGQNSGGKNAEAKNDDEPGAAEPGNRRRRRRGRDRERDEQFQGEPVECEGVLDLRDEGYGFLRTQGLLPSNDDVYVAAKQVRQFELRRGDRVAGAARPAARNEKNPALVRVDQINGGQPDAARGRPVFDQLTPLFPDERLQLARTEQPWDLTPRIIDLLTPIGKGQRGLIVSPPKAGKTTIMKELAKSIEVNSPDVHLIVLLIDERPEEVTDMRRSVNGEVMASTFDRPVEEHIAVAELTLERAKRMVESGADVVIVLDGITRLARAYNMAAPGTGRMMSGGVDAGALYPPKKFFGTARNLEEGGSLTILATALVETGSRMDEVIFEEFKGTGNMELRLDRRVAEKGLFPAVDVDASSTRRPELLMDRRCVDQLAKLRKVLQGLGGDADGPAGAGLELLIDRISSFKTNDEFLDEIGNAKS